MRVVQENRAAWFGEGQCRYCGTAWGGRVDETGRHACEATTCRLCGVRTCMGYGLGNGTCPVCLVGLLDGWSSSSGACYRGARFRSCPNPRAAFIRQRFVCLSHVTPALVETATRMLDECLEKRDAPQWRRMVEVADEIERRRPAEARPVLRAQYEREIARYGRSSPEITLACRCADYGRTEHVGRHQGSGRRTGLRTWAGGVRPVYELRTTDHAELRGRLAVLTPDGLDVLPVEGDPRKHARRRR